MERYYKSLLDRYLSYFPCVVLLGPRQCGKTTFLQELPVDWKRFDLERTSDFELISRDPDLFFRLNSSRVAIDEAQIIPEIFRALRVAVDNQREQKGRFVMTGSSSPALLGSVSESLAGRVGTIEMAPFSCREAYGVITQPSLASCLSGPSPIDSIRTLLKPNMSLKQVHQYWLKGGYPEPWLSIDPQFHQTWMEQYVLTYIQRDIARLFPGLNQDRFRLFIRLLAGLSGTIVNYSNVARALGVSAPTVRDYFEIAHGSFIWRNIPAFERKTTKRLVKHPRGYLRDAGFLHHLLRISNEEALLIHPQMGASWEGLVIEEILRGLHAGGVDYAASYYRTGAGAEVDLVLEGAFGLIPIEIKHTQLVSTRVLRGLAQFIEDNKCSLGVVINNDEKIQLYSEKIIGIPFNFL